MLPKTSNEEVLPKLNSDKPQLQDHPHMRLDYRHTDKYLRVVIFFIARINVKKYIYTYSLGEGGGNFFCTHTQTDT